MFVTFARRVCVYISRVHFFSMLAKSDFSEIMIPIYKFRKLILPNPDFKSSQHNPFPNHFVHIVGIEDEITVLSSLQRPRKITLKGSDGKK